MSDQPRNISVIGDPPLLRALETIKQMSPPETGSAGPARAAFVAPCIWTIDDWGGDSEASTGCKEGFCFESDPPHDWMKFCCYCGKPVQFTYTSKERALAEALDEEGR